MLRPHHKHTVTGIQSLSRAVLSIKSTWVNIIRRQQYLLSPNSSKASLTVRMLLWEMCQRTQNLSISLQRTLPKSPPGVDSSMFPTCFQSPYRMWSIELEWSLCVCVGCGYAEVKRWYLAMEGVEWIADCWLLAVGLHGWQSGLMSVSPIMRLWLMTYFKFFPCLHAHTMAKRATYSTSYHPTPNPHKHTLVTWIEHTQELLKTKTLLE